MSHALLNYYKRMTLPTFVASLFPSFCCKVLYLKVKHVDRILLSSLCNTTLDVNGIRLRCL